jgi:glycosyltransferase involved in cell wall biosynthesis
MRILFFIDSLRSGGKERRLVELLKGFKLVPDLEFEVVVMSNDVHYTEVLDLNVTIHYLLRKRKKDVSAFIKFYKICKVYNPDIVHCWDSMTAIYAILACKLLKIKLVNGMIASAPAKYNIFHKYWIRNRIAFYFSDIIISNSKAGLTAYNAPKNKSAFIYNGFNFERINNLVASDLTRKELNITTKYVIGMVASFSEFKDYKTYLSAAEMLLSQRNDITFLAVGSDTDCDSIRSLINNRYADHFRLLGKKTDIESLIHCMDICVLSTFTEGISNSILEYMALAKPVIATSGGGTNEIVEDGKTGFLISQKSQKELAGKIEFLLNNPDSCIKMGQAGKKRITQVFAIGLMTNKYISFYKTLTTNIKMHNDLKPSNVSQTKEICIDAQSDI